MSKLIVFHQRSRPSTSNGKERIFRKVRIIIRGDDGEEMTADEWRRNFLKTQDFDDFTFSTLKNRFDQLDRAQSMMNDHTIKSLEKRPTGISASLRDRIERFGGSSMQFRGNPDSESLDDASNQLYAIKEDDDDVLQMIGKRVKRGLLVRPQTADDEDEDTEEEDDEAESAADKEDERGYDYGVVQTIVMNTAGKVVGVEERLAQEGEAIDVSQGDYDGRDECFIGGAEEDKAREKSGGAPAALKDDVKYVDVEKEEWVDCNKDDEGAEKYEVEEDGERVEKWHRRQKVMRRVRMRRKKDLLSKLNVGAIDAAASESLIHAMLIDSFQKKLMRVEGKDGKESVVDDDEWIADGEEDEEDAEARRKEEEEKKKKEEERRKRREERERKKKEEEERKRKLAEEREARRIAEEKRREEEMERKRIADEEKRRKEEEERRRREEEDNRRRIEEEKKKRQEEEERQRKAVEEERKRLIAEEEERKKRGVNEDEWYDLVSDPITTKEIPISFSDPNTPQLFGPTGEKQLRRSIIEADTQISASSSSVPSSSTAASDTASASASSSSSAQQALLAAAAAWKLPPILLKKSTSGIDKDGTFGMWTLAEEEKILDVIDRSPEEEEKEKEKEKAHNDIILDDDGAEVVELELDLDELEDELEEDATSLSFGGRAGETLMDPALEFVEEGVEEDSDTDDDDGLDESEKEDPSKKRKLPPLMTQPADAQDPLSLLLPMLQPYYKAATEGMKRLWKRKPTEAGLNRAACEGVASVDEGMADLGEVEADKLIDSRWLVTTLLVEAEIEQEDSRYYRKSKREKEKEKSKHSRTITAMGDQFMNEITERMREKGKAGADYLIRRSIRHYKRALRFNDAYGLAQSNAEVLVLFKSRALVPKFDILADEELISGIAKRVEGDPRGKNLDLTKTLAVLSYHPLCPPLFLKYNVIPLLAGLFMDTNVGKDVVQPFAEVCCALMPNSECRTVILQQNALKKTLIVTYSAKDMYDLTMLLRLIFIVSQSQSDMVLLIRAEGVRCMVDLARRHAALTPMIACLTMGILKNFLRDRTLMGEMIEKDVVSVCFRILEENTGAQADTAYNCLAIISTLSELQEGRKAIAAEAENGMKTIVSVLNMYSGSDLRIVLCACLVLNLMVLQRRENVNILTGCGGGAAMAAIIHKHAELPPETLTSACGVLSALVLNNKDARTDPAVSGVVPVVGLLLNTHHMTHMKMTENLCGIMYGLGFVQKSLMMLGNLMSVQTLLETLRMRYRDCPVLTMYALGSCAQLVTVNSFAFSFISANGVSVIDDILTLYGLNVDFNWDDRAAHPDTDPRSTIFKGVQDVVQIIEHATLCLMITLPLLSDEQRKQTQKTPLTATVMSVMKRFIGSNQAITENSASILFSLKVSTGPFSEFKSLLKKAKKEYPSSIRLDDSS
eukprot:MONOS_1205.1-p1 / transcript=MONOS_1205.1 / gene=MONOS_1205 / organism=Monocercomonoides_exilis_PA203 / gene_product=unspecified product / transcript_product=unspecified product / location=Mono_scaffold00020:169125-173474(-) / protein_length=1419 / sequence_SO=supercontig / SO=protein_coding / is_pseudo=false